MSIEVLGPVLKFPFIPDEVKSLFDSILFISRFRTRWRQYYWQYQNVRCIVRCEALIVQTTLVTSREIGDIVAGDCEVNSSFDDDCNSDDDGDDYCDGDDDGDV